MCSLAHSSKCYIFKPPTICNNSDNPIAARLNFELSEAKKFHVVVVEPMLSLCKMFSIHNFIGLDLLSYPLALILRTCGVRWITSDHQNRLVFYSLRSLHLRADRWK